MRTMKNKKKGKRESMGVEDEAAEGAEGRRSEEGCCTGSQGQTRGAKEAEETTPTHIVATTKGKKEEGEEEVEAGIEEEETRAAGKASSDLEEINTHSLLDCYLPRNLLTTKARKKDDGRAVFPRRNEPPQDR